MGHANSLSQVTQIHRLNGLGLFSFIHAHQFLINTTITHLIDGLLSVKYVF